MFLLILSLYSMTPGDGVVQTFRFEYATADQCLDARDAWIAQHKTKRPAGFERGWRMSTFPNCFDRDWNFVRRNTPAHQRLPTG